MRSYVTVAILTALLVSVACFAARRTAPKANADIVDQNYVLALSAANRFLFAWQTRDQTRGLALLSPGIRHRRTEEDLQTSISGMSNPHHEAYEVTSGKRLSDGRYAFEVRLYVHYTAEWWRAPGPKLSRIVLTKKGPEEWLVDELPVESPFKPTKWGSVPALDVSRTRK